MKSISTECNKKSFTVIEVKNQGNICKKDEICLKNIDEYKIETDKLNKGNKSSDIRELGIKKVNVNGNNMKIQPENRFVDLTKTRSGTTVLALDEDVIALIEDPNLSVSLKKTVSGHYLINVNSAEKMSKNKNVIIVKMYNESNPCTGCDIPGVSDTSHKCHVDVVGDEKMLEINYKQIESNNSTTELNTKPHVQTNEFTIKNTTDNLFEINLESKNLYSENNQFINMHSVSSSNNEIKDEDRINVNKKNTNVLENKDKQFSRKEVPKVNNTISLKRLSQKSMKSDNFQNSQQNDAFKNCNNKNVHSLHDKTFNDVLLKSIHEDHVESSKNMQTQEKRANPLSLHTKESRPSILQELTEMYDHGQTKLKVRVNGENGVYRNINCTLTKTLSGNVAIDVKNLKSVGEICFKAREYPVILTRDFKDQLTLDLTRISDHKKANSVLRKTTSGGLLVVTIPPVLKSMDITETAARFKSDDGIFQVKVKGLDNELIQPSAVLELTPSGNYIFVLDKEFETSYKNTIRDYVGDDVRCSVGLAKTNSGNYKINFEKLGKQDDCNALLVKSNSGNIKVLVTGSEFTALEKIAPKRYSRQHLNMSRQFGELLNKMPSLGIKSTYSQKILYSDKRSNSDSNLYKKNKFSNCETPFSDTSALLEKTPSNHYAVVLNKESKKKFINNLKNYLASSPNGLVPIRKTESGEIVIVLSGNREGNEQYGSLKITSSGNIYVSVDEKVIQTISKGVFTEKKTKELNVPSEHIVGLLMYPQNKAIATTCNARPNDGCCDGTKCVCNELQFTRRGWLQEFHETCCSSSKSLSEAYSVRDNKTSDSSLTCDSHFRCYCLKKKVNNRKLCDQFSQIVMRPESNVQVSEQNSVKKQCFFVTESSFRFHEGRYDYVSNDLLEMSGFCNNRDSKPGNIIASGQTTQIDYLNHFNDNFNFDSLNYLPPQLPPFLSGFTYK